MEAPFPEIQYPMVGKEAANQQEEEASLKAVRRLIESGRAEGNPVAAIIIEPIQFNENRIASPFFYKNLQSIAQEYGVAFIADETRTGMGATGRMWGYQHWHLAYAFSANRRAGRARTT